MTVCDHYPEGWDRSLTPEEWEQRLEESKKWRGKSVTPEEAIRILKSCDPPESTHRQS